MREQTDPNKAIITAFFLILLGMKIDVSDTGGLSGKAKKGMEEVKASGYTKSQANSNQRAEYI
ncbi:MAG: hypothetical protein M3297_15220 [Thermoproteota archaeon]|nr:hypothetical protein [Thermoproteota archaeon]